MSAFGASAHLIVHGTRQQILVEAASLRQFHQIFIDGSTLILRNVISSIHLGIDFDMGISWNHFVGNGNAITNLNSGINNGIVLHVAHGDEIIDLCDPEPMQRIRHQLLKAHILDTGDACRAMEIRFRAISTLLTLTSVVHKELGHFPKRPPLLAEVHNHANTTFLSSPHALFNAVNQIWTASTDIRSENIRAARNYLSRWSTPT
mmetsp:Transcript_74018/g.197253  ORF Transcript_74018/g.197253 Transcript_74018/m.197253 type:complete len:205 (+) Transcript_74018:203-817(+)